MFIRNLWLKLQENIFEMRCKTLNAAFEQKRKFETRFAHGFYFHMATVGLDEP